MNNLINYLKWRGDLGFDISPLNEVDALIFFRALFILIFRDIQKKITASAFRHK